MASTGGIVSTPRVVGMCGLPAHAAAGIRAPVVEDPEGVFWPGDPEPEVAPPTEHDVAYMKRTLTRAVSVEVVELEGQGHFIPWQRPEEIRHAVESIRDLKQ